MKLLLWIFKKIYIGFWEIHFFVPNSNIQNKEQFVSEEKMRERLKELHDYYGYSCWVDFYIVNKYCQIQIDKYHEFHK